MLTGRTPGESGMCRGWRRSSKGDHRGDPQAVALLGSPRSQESSQEGLQQSPPLELSKCQLKLHRRVQCSCGLRLPLLPSSQVCLAGAEAGTGCPTSTCAGCGLHCTTLCHAVILATLPLLQHGLWGGRCHHVHSNGEAAANGFGRIELRDR